MSDIPKVPSPWVLKATAYAFGFWVPRKEVREKGLPSIAYSPLEGSSSYANLDNSRPLGGLAMVELFRYTESPVGPYDEIILTPGFHEYTVDGKDGKPEKRKNTRVTRIYVSQKHTCWNGRKSTLVTAESLGVADPLAQIGTFPSTWRNLNGPPTPTAPKRSASFPTTRVATPAKPPSARSLSFRRPSSRCRTSPRFRSRRRRSSISVSTSPSSPRLFPRAREARANSPARTSGAPSCQGYHLREPCWRGLTSSSQTMG